MNFTLYRNMSEVNKVNKNITELTQLTGTLKEESSIIDPVILVAGIDNYLANANFAYIPEFHRYYFITNIESVRTNLWRITMHVDVLYTYKEYIWPNYAIIQRNEIEYDLKLNDGLFKTQQNPRIQQLNFPGGFTRTDFVLAIAGN